MRSEDGSDGCVSLCGTALVYAAEIQRRVLINQESSKQVARSLGLTPRQVFSVARIVKTFGGVPSQERLAVIVMQAPDLSDADIAAWFGRPTSWATRARENQEAISRDEWIPAEVSWVADEWEPDDPTPDEIRERCKAIRAKEERPFPAPQGWTPPQFYFHGGRVGTFISVRA